MAAMLAGGKKRGNGHGRLMRWDGEGACCFFDLGMALSDAGFTQREDIFPQRYFIEHVGRMGEKGGEGRWVLHARPACRHPWCSAGGTDEGGPLVSACVVHAGAGAWGPVVSAKARRGLGKGAGARRWAEQ
ncbi:hypothetical protein E2562_002498 [Oryza meyeriana var. granulata]|uniref:Uncharacterized protein n=1 Tax=Oryza meyeriana var. granulata TaxID=110450 RepID=A0A6G1F2N6_9ORYZ|nr:hypothetical protein E2562_002498 [Oryza meyeriana var. granulata]